ncbi:MAG: DNA primase, partial [candidate division WOR-3 bacterium]
RYGVPLSYKDLGAEGARQSRKRQRLYELHELARDFYHDILNSTAGKAGREYLAGRGLSPEVIETYHLGYAPSEWGALRSHLQKKGASMELAQEAGLLLPRARGGWYDRFRDRVMFPITDRSGRVIAFGGRIVGEGEPKYLNSPESPLYSKGRHLFGLPQAAAAIRQQDVALVVEGYMDLLTLRGHGIEPVVAVLGTALTREQVRLLKSLVSRVVLVFDGDVAGGKAMCRAFPLFAQEGLAVRVLSLPGGHDPDSYVLSHGVELFHRSWESAQSWFAYLLESLIAVHGLDIEGRVRIVGALKPYLAGLRDPVEEGLWLKFAAERLGVEEAWLRRSLRQQSEVSPVRSSNADQLVMSVEQSLLSCIINHPAAFSLSELEEWCEDLEDRELSQLLTLIIENYRQWGTLDHRLLVHQVSDERQKQKICALMLTNQEDLTGPEDRLAADWRRVFRIRRLRKAQQAIKERLLKASELSAEEVMGLLAQRRDIDRQLEALKVQATIKGENG